MHGPGTVAHRVRKRAIEELLAEPKSGRILLFDVANVDHRGPKLEPENGLSRSAPKSVEEFGIEKFDLCLTTVKACLAKILPGADIAAF